MQIGDRSNGLKPLGTEMETFAMKTSVTLLESECEGSRFGSHHDMLHSNPSCIRLYTPVVQITMDW